MKLKTPEKEDLLMKIVQGLDLCMSEVSQAMPSLFPLRRPPGHLQLPKKNCWLGLKNSIVRRSIFSFPKHSSPHCTSPKSISIRSVPTGYWCCLTGIWAGPICMIWTVVYMTSPRTSLSMKLLAKDPGVFTQSAQLSPAANWWCLLSQTFCTSSQMWSVKPSANEFFHVLEDRACLILFRPPWPNC